MRLADGGQGTGSADAAALRAAAEAAAKRAAEAAARKAAEEAARKAAEEAAKKAAERAAHEAALKHAGHHRYGAYTQPLHEPGQGKGTGPLNKQGKANTTELAEIPAKLFKVAEMGVKEVYGLNPGKVAHDAKGAVDKLLNGDLGQKAQAAQQLHKTYKNTKSGATKATDIVGTFTKEMKRLQGEGHGLLDSTLGAAKKAAGKVGEHFMAAFHKKVPIKGFMEKLGAAGKDVQNAREFKLFHSAGAKAAKTGENFVKHVDTAEKIVNSAGALAHKVGLGKPFDAVRAGGGKLLDHVGNGVLKAGEKMGMRAAEETAARGAGKAAAEVAGKALGRFAPGVNIAIAAMDAKHAYDVWKDPKSSGWQKGAATVTAVASAVAATDIPVVSQAAAAVSIVSSVAENIKPKAVIKEAEHLASDAAKDVSKAAHAVESFFGF